MGLPLALILGFVPALLWLRFVHGKDELEPEPRHLVLLVFACGCGAAVVTLALRPTFEPWLPWQPPWWRDALDAWVVTAGIEETLKVAACAGVILWHREMDEPMDGLVYGAAAGLGFAAVENSLYLVMTGNASLVLARAFTSTLAHVACSGVAGFGLGRLRFRPRRWGPAIAGWSFAVVMHGAYDYFLFGYALWWLSLLGALPLMLVWFACKVRWAGRRSARFHPRLAAAAGRSKSMPMIAATIEPPSTPSRM